jgi:hypothetical protein
MSVLISCEVGGDRVPARWSGGSSTEAGDPAEASSRFGLWFPVDSDPASGYAARRMASRLAASLVAHDNSPELIDVTHSLHHRDLFSAWTRLWPSVERAALIEQIYRPYRWRVRTAIRQQLNRSRYVIHLSIRTFPPRHRGKHRRADVGLLYDPACDEEVDFCLDWIDEMYEALPMLRVRRNYPRRGTSDSLTKAMRSEFSGEGYLGIEVLMNRAWIGRDLPIRNDVLDTMCDSLRAVTSVPRSDVA